MYYPCVIPKVVYCRLAIAPLVFISNLHALSVSCLIDSGTDTLFFSEKKKKIAEKPKSILLPAMCGANGADTRKCAALDTCVL